MFVNYLKDKTPLEERLLKLYEELGITNDQRKSVEVFLAPLRDKGIAYHFHYEHSIRVALLGVAVAKFMHVERKVMLYAGLLHDVGKVQTPAETLSKTSGWTPKDTEAIKPHVVDGYRMLRGKFDFTASVMLWHHRFQANSYPSVLPSVLHPYSEGSRTMIRLYGRLLSLCDQFDAFHRVNDKQGEEGVLTGEVIKSLMLRLNPDQTVLINELYDAGIFTTYMESPEAILA